jgi:hypothetical protein
MESVLPKINIFTDTDLLFLLFRDYAAPHKHARQ